MTTSAAQWNPSEVLDINPHSAGFTCVGHAKTQGRRCHNIIAKDNRGDASRTLRDMSQQNVQTANFDSQLESLAHRLLCRRWHVKDRGQISSKIDQWKSAIARHRDAQTARQTQRTIHPAATSTAAASGTQPDLLDTLQSLQRELTALNERYTTALQLVAPMRAASPTPSHTVRRVESSLAASVTGRDEQGQGHRSPSADPSIRSVEFEVVYPVTRQATQLAEEENDEAEDQSLHSRASTLELQPTESDPVPASPQSEAGTSTEVFASARSSVEPLNSAEQLEQSTEDQVTVFGGQTRRRIEGECPICCEDITSGTSIFWCRAQCGHNFHAECIDNWHDTQEDDYRTPNCPHCRAEWIG